MTDLLRHQQTRIGPAPPERPAPATDRKPHASALRRWRRDHDHRRNSSPWPDRACRCLLLSALRTWSDITACRKCAKERSQSATVDCGDKMAHILRISCDQRSERCKSPGRRGALDVVSRVASFNCVHVRGDIDAWVREHPTEFQYA
jgi:hypothetical protein